MSIFATKAIVGVSCQNGSKFRVIIACSLLAFGFGFLHTDGRGSILCFRDQLRQVSGGMETFVASGWTICTCTCACGKLGSMGGRRVCTDACRPSPFCIETVQYSCQKFGLGLLLLFGLGVLFKIIVFIS